MQTNMYFCPMENREDFYRNRIESYALQADKLKKHIHTIGSLRLAVTLGWIFVLWLLWAQSWPILTAITLLFALPFAGLLHYHNRLFAHRAYAERMIELNRNELKGLQYDFSAFDGAAEKCSADHSFSLDLDLFGSHSLFQSINRTVTALGRELLADWLQNPLTDTNEILARQEAIQELAEQTDLRQHFYVKGCTQPLASNDRERLQQLLHSPERFVKNRFWNIMIWIVPTLWIILAIATALGLIDSSALSIYLLFCLILSSIPAKAITSLYHTVDKLEQLFRTYADLIRTIEHPEQFHAPLLRKISHDLSGEVSASDAIRQLSSYINALNQRFSLAGLLLNLLCLRDMRQAILIERWKEQYINQADGWLKAMARFDAFSSLAGFAFNHPDYIYPQLSDRYFKMEGKALGHPLLDRNVCVRNNIAIEKSSCFLIITGANMAGKSTYLRTIGVNYLLACVGAPVCAEQLTVSPAHLITSLRTSDSLASNESYFFAELKRLKRIIDHLQRGEQLFIILDEILKGTNSIDKQKGSLALVEQLISLHSCGIIATHDLVLGSLAEAFPQQIRNYCFEADINNNELSFSYQMREGIAQNMNACFLMKKMGIFLDQPPISSDTSL